MELAKVESLLLRQKPYVRSYSYALAEDAALVTGDVVAGMMYNGGALMLAEHNANIDYVVPEEGSNLWIDYLTVLQASGNQDLARAFVDFLNEPATAAQNAQFVHCATTNAAARKLLPAAVLADTRIYPTEDVLAKSEVSAALPPRAEKRRSLIYAKVAY